MSARVTMSPIPSSQGNIGFGNQKGDKAEGIRHLRLGLCNFANHCCSPSHTIAD